METKLAAWFADTADGKEADSILRACVHCGFCTATCPTYQLLGDENDGPRGRIYLMKQVMEGAEPTVATMTHLDRCLTCRNCESTCPSGVQYGRLVDIGRALVEKRVTRPPLERAKRIALKEGVTRRWLFDPAMKLGRMVRPLVPATLRKKLLPPRDPGAWPARTHARKVLMLNGCVQPSMMPNIDAATARVLDRIGVQVVIEKSSGCCGAIRHHLSDHEGFMDEARRNIDAWWPLIDAEHGIDAIVINASGCTVMVKDYAHLLRNDSAYAQKAARISAMTRDLVEWLPERIETWLQERASLRDRASLQERASLQDRALHPASAPARIAFHSPCTLQHGQKIRGVVEKLIVDAGASLVHVRDSHLCCGSAGTYSILQPELSTKLRDDKLAALGEGAPDLILSANIGCLSHLQSGTQTPLMHWIEWLDDLQGRH